MGSEHYPLRRSGIYRNLPTFDPALVDLKAIVVGATGISGLNTIRALLDTPSRWSSIHALSRRPFSEETLALLDPEQQRRIQHVPVDLTGSAEDIASALREWRVSADYVFFFAYVHPSGVSAMDPHAEEQLSETNVPIFRKFLEALPLAKIPAKRILLQTGGKSYGAQIGRARTPYVESDPQPKHLSRNFYYDQEALLFDYCEKHPECSWNIIRPFGVIGSCQNIALNIFSPLRFSPRCPRGRMSRSSLAAMWIRGKPRSCILRRD
jgi:nucleoside-diphosphate-sugar epimerase